MRGELPRVEGATDCELLAGAGGCVYIRDRQLWVCVCKIHDGGTKGYGQIGCKCGPTRDSGVANFK